MIEVKLISSFYCQSARLYALLTHLLYQKTLTTTLNMIFPLNDFSLLPFGLI